MDNKASNASHNQNTQELRVPSQMISAICDLFCLSPSSTVQHCEILATVSGWLKKGSPKGWLSSPFQTWVQNSNCHYWLPNIPVLCFFNKFSFENYSDNVHIKCLKISFVLVICDILVIALHVLKYKIDIKVLHKG